MNFFGLFDFQVCLKDLLMYLFLPSVLSIFAVLLGNTVILDFIGMSVGHLYNFLEDVFPLQPDSFRVLQTPSFLRTSFDNRPSDADYVPLPEDRPGGFDWGDAEVQPSEED